VSGPGPLSDLRVLDLTRVLAGPYCTMLLADLGADVVKVEPPQGDPTRALGAYAADDELHAYGGYYQSVNRNKRGLALDLQQEAAREVVRRLVEHSDALVENFRAGVMERLGLGYESLRERNPTLVYAAIRGFGDPRTGASPYLEWPAYDITAQALGGFMGITGAGPGEPYKAGPGIGDVFPAALAAVGLLAAVHHARRTGEGQFLDVAMYDGVLALCERIVHQYSYGGEVPQPQGNTHPLLSPFDCFRTRDGQVTIAAPEPNHWAALAGAMGRPELAEDERFRTNADRLRHRSEVEAIVASWCSERTNLEVRAALAGRVPVAPVQSVAEIMADPHVAARQMLAEVEQPGSAQTRRIVGPPIKLTATPAAVRTRAPLLGEHSDAVLAEIGYGDTERAELYAQGAVLRP
jgi:crotonobetainyl-CoA:carnitine CoA-transferase CaiB-like acyl-CoA transferase